MESPMMPAPMTTTSAWSRMTHGRERLDGGLGQVLVRRDQAAVVDEFVGRVVERAALGVRAAAAGRVDEGFGRARIPKHACASWLKIDVVRTAGDKGALEPRAAVGYDLTRPQPFEERGE